MKQALFQGLLAVCLAILPIFTQAMVLSAGDALTSPTPTSPPTPTPTVHCHSTDIALGITASSNGYIPSVPITFTLSGNWPTSPTLVYWSYENLYNYRFRSGSSEPALKQTFVFHEYNTYYIVRAYAEGPGKSPDCPSWSGRAYSEVSPGACPDICGGRLLYPRRAQENLPLSFIAECSPDSAFLAVETVSGNHRGAVKRLNDGRYHVSGLLPSTTYILYFFCGCDCHDKAVIQLAGFITGKELVAGSAWLLLGENGVEGSSSLTGEEILGILDDQQLQSVLNRREELLLRSRAPVGEGCRENWY